MAQTITFDETSQLAASGGSVESALNKMAAALQSLGDAGSQARSVLDSLRKSLQATAAQSTRSARSLAKFDEINRLSAPKTETASTSGSKSSGKTPTAKPETEEELTLWQRLLQTLRGLWAAFWDYLQTYYGPAIAAWQAAWAQIRGAAMAVWEPLRAAALQLWNGVLVPLAQYLATVFLPGVVNSFSQAFAPIVGGVVSTAITVLGNTFTGLCSLIGEAVTTVVQPALALLLSIWQDLMTGIQNAWAVYGQPLLEGAAQAFQSLADLVSTLWTGTLQPLLVRLIAGLEDLWNSCLNPLWQQLTMTLGAVMNLLVTLWNTVLAPLADWLTREGIAGHLEVTDYGPRGHSEENLRNSACFYCARLRRKRLFTLCREYHLTHLAFGHNNDDLVSNFLMNLVQTGKVAGMSMNEPFFGGALQVIRPLMLLSKAEIVRAARQWELPVFSNPCPSAGKTKRADMMEVLDSMCAGSRVRRKNIYNGLARWQWEQNRLDGMIDGNAGGGIK